MVAEEETADGFSEIISEASRELLEVVMTKF